MDEQQNETTNATSNETGPDDSEPTPERQAELRKAYDANVAVGLPPYAKVAIETRGDLQWIIHERGWGTGYGRLRGGRIDLRDSAIEAELGDIDLEDANLSGATIVDANFEGANLDSVNLSACFIIRANFVRSNLSNADLSGAILVNADFTSATLQFSSFRGTRVISTIFSKANLNLADLTQALIAEGDFGKAVMVAVNLSGAVVSGNLKGADMTHVRMDAATVFGDQGANGKAQLDTTTCLLDASWNGVNLVRVTWDEAPRLGDESDIKDASSRQERVQAYRDAARAYFGLAKALEAQGLIAPALRYRRRQHQLERAAQLRSFNLLGWLFSSALNLVSGYGDRPLRAFGVYLTVILAFAGVYFGITTPGSPIFFGGSQPLQLHEAVVFSLSSFHGRGFFPSTIGLGDPVAIVAALEAVVGLFIELVLIATFTRRLFER